MKNYIIRTLNKVKNPVWGGGARDDWAKDRRSEGDIFENYKKMHELTIPGFEAFIPGDWELIFWSKEVDNIKETFRDNFYDLYNLFKSEPCNILYLGCDVQAIAPVEIFGKYKKFQMFNYTDPRSYRGIEHYFNADIRYYPAEMDQSVWDEGLKWAENWDMEDWGYEQIVLNRMMWSQDITLEEALIPEMAYQAFGLPDNKDAIDAWNGITLEESKLIHWHGSRNSPQKVALIKHAAEATGVIPEETA